MAKSATCPSCCCCLCLGCSHRLWPGTGSGSYWLLCCTTRKRTRRHKPRISKVQIPWLLRGAIRSNNVETLQYLLSYPNKVDPSMVIGGVCPLNLAVELGFVQIVKMLVKAGADIHVADAPRYPLHQASLYGRASLVSILVRSGASVFVLTERRQSCLHLLAHQSGERYLETARTLLELGANPNCLDDDGLAPLHRASAEMAKMLASHPKTDLNIVSRDGDTPLLTAVKDRRESVLLALLLADQQYGEEQEQQQQQHQQEEEERSVRCILNTDHTPSAVNDSGMIIDGGGDCNNNNNNNNNINNSDNNNCPSSDINRHSPAFRTSSSKSTNSVASARITLAVSTNSAIFRHRVSATSESIPATVFRASSTAAVNLHSANNNNNNNKTVNKGNNLSSSNNQHPVLADVAFNVRRNTQPRKPVLSCNRSKFSFGQREGNRKIIRTDGNDDDLDWMLNTIDGDAAKVRSCLHCLNAGSRVKVQYSSCASCCPRDASLSGGVIHHADTAENNNRHSGRFRKAENCQRCHSVGNPSDVSGWWQNCDRVQRILTKAASAVQTLNLNNSTPKQLRSGGGNATDAFPCSPSKRNPSNSFPPVSSTPKLPSAPLRTRLDLDHPDKIGMSALMVAAEAGNSGLAMIRALINADCNEAATDKIGMTALHHASYVGALHVVRFFLERVSTTTTTTIATSTTAGVASMSPSGHSLVTPASSDTRDTTSGAASSPNCISHSSSVMFNSFYGHVSNAAGDGSRIVLRDLLDTQDKYGRTPIYLAACRGHTEVVNYLLSLSADFHRPNKEHKSPLYMSAYFGYLEITNALLRRGAQVDQMDSHRKTPLYVATYHGRTEVVDLLLAAGANVNAADKNGKTPLYVAVLHGNISLAQKLLRAGASVNRVDRDGLGPLHMAVKFPKLDIPMIKLLLLNYGCDPVNLASFTRWLLHHGIIPPECIHGDAELAQWLHREECNVRSLKRICRVAIQRALGNTDSMRSRIARLPLPEYMRSYVSMKEL